MRKLNNNRGLTLIEIIVTLAVLGVVVTPLMSMFITSQKINNESEMKYKAIQLAQQHLEIIKAGSTLDTGTYPSKGGGSFGRTFPPDSNGYVIDINIQKGETFGSGSIDLVDIPSSYDVEYTITDTGEYTIKITDSITKDVKINLDLVSGSVANIKIDNDYDDVKFYIYKLNTDLNYIISGNASVIEVQEDLEKPDNILYEITVVVSKNGDVIDTIRGTKVFEIEPN